MPVILLIGSLLTALFTGIYVYSGLKGGVCAFSSFALALISLLKVGL